MVRKAFSSKSITLKKLGDFTEQVILPGVESVVKPLIEDAVKPLRDEMRKGFADINKSIQILEGTVAELVENTKEQKHEERIRVLEQKAGVR